MYWIIHTKRPIFQKTNFCKKTNLKRRICKFFVEFLQLIPVNAAIIRGLSLCTKNQIYSTIMIFFMCGVWAVTDCCDKTNKRKLYFLSVKLFFKVIFIFYSFNIQIHRWSFSNMVFLHDPKVKLGSRH